MTRSLYSFAAIALAALVLSALAPSAHADQLVWGIGRITDTHGRPLAGATVAVYNDANHIVDYATTNAQGEYVLTLPQNLLHLPHGHGGFLAQVFGDITHLVGGVAGFIANPLRAGVHTLANSEAAGLVNPLSRGGAVAASVVLDEALFAVTPRPDKERPEQARKLPGALFLKAISSDRADLVAVARIYWMQDNIFQLDGHTHKTRLIWIDPLQMASVNSSHPSRVVSSYLTFTGARLVPSLASPGQTVKILAKIKVPHTPAIPMIVVARDSRTGRIWQLHKRSNGLYEAEFTVDNHFPVNDQQISILAYPASSQTPGRRLNVENALLHSGMWNPRQTFIYNPLLTASRNRADLTLTVLPAGTAIQ